MLDYLVPLMLFAACAVALHKKQNAYDIMLGGAADGCGCWLLSCPLWSYC